MTARTELSAPKRRTRAEVQQFVAEFVSSGMRRSEFCQSRGLSFSTLDRHLKKLRWKRRRKPISSAGRLVPVDLDARKSPKQQVRDYFSTILPGLADLPLRCLPDVTPAVWAASVPHIASSTVPSTVRSSDS